MKTKGFAKGFTAILGGKLSATAITILITPLLVRLLGSNGYGDYSFVLAIYGLVSVFVGFGLFNSIRKHIAERPEDKEWVGKISTQGFFWGILIFILSLLTFHVVIRLPWINYFNNYLPFINVLTIGFFGGQIFLISRSTLFGLFLEEKIEVLNPVRKIFFALIALPLAYFGFGALGAVTGFSLALLLVGTISFIRVYRRVNFNREYLSEVSIGIKILSFGKIFVLFSFLSVVLYKFDIIIVNHFLGSSSTGLYKAALVSSQYLWFVPKAIQPVLLHSSSYIWEREGAEKISQLTSKLMKYSLTLVLLMAIGLGILAEPFLSIYFGQEFVVAKHSLMILLPGVVLFTTARIGLNPVSGKGEPEKLIMANVVPVIANVVLNLLLIPFLDIVGAAIATSISYSLFGLLVHRTARNVGFNPFLNFPKFRLLMSGVLTFLVLFGFREIVPGVWTKIIVLSPFGLIIYTVLVIKFNVITVSELDEIVEKLPQPVKRAIEPIFRKIRPALQFIDGI